MIPAFPKIFALGTTYVKDIFNGSVEITEKIDGSQFVFGKVNGELFLRSKGAQLYVENPEKMFAEAIHYVESIQDKVLDNMIFFSEYLKKPKHNVLAYNRIPVNHLILFGVMHSNEEFELNLPEYASLLGIESVPVLYTGRIDRAEELSALLERDSVLGGVKIEGIVVKNYERKFLIGGKPMPLMASKLVSEVYKEVHKRDWKTGGKATLEMFFDSFRTEARWEKAVQHLKEQGVLEEEPRDIGKLIKEVHTDIVDEEKEDIKNFLWKEHNGVLLRRSTAGLAEWYKDRLMKSTFEKETE